MPELYGIAKAALLLGVDARTITRWRDSGRLPQAAGWTEEELRAAKRARPGKSGQKKAAPGQKQAAEPGGNGQGRAPSPPASSGDDVSAVRPPAAADAPPSSSPSRALIEDLQLPHVDDAIAPAPTKTPSSSTAGAGGEKSAPAPAEQPQSDGLFGGWGW